MLKKRPRRPERSTESASTLTMHNVIVSGRRTSVRLEPMMWQSLQDIAHRSGRSLTEIITDINRQRAASSLTSAIRVFIVSYYRGEVERAAAGWAASEFEATHFVGPQSAEAAR